MAESSSVFYHLWLSPKPGVTKEQIEKVLNLSRDWFKYGDNCWVLFSSSGTDKWHERLLPLVKGGGRYFIVEFDVTKKYGWMNKGFWEWFKSPPPR